MGKLKSRIWWEYLDHDHKELFIQSHLLLKTAQEWEKSLTNGRDTFHDYAFIVFPAAKAYEGFLKSLFLDMGFITQSEFKGKRIRVGKALNPSLYVSEMKKHRRYRRMRKRLSIYDKLTIYCNGPELADKLWTTWRQCRNQLFHWFPSEKNAIDLGEAKEKLNQILDTMDLAFKECKIK